MLMLDIDHFKKINDTYGHCSGDSVLKTLADIVRSNVRKIDYLVRWGGEEFIVLSPETPVDVACALAERIRKKVESYKCNFGKITVSFGVTEFSEDDTKDSFINKADAALYEAKGKGRNRVEVAVLVLFHDVQLLSKEISKVSPFCRLLSLNFLMSGFL